MPSFRTTRHVPFTPRQMFDLVADVERYPLFLPLCESLTVKRRTTVGATAVLVAIMGVGYKAIQESFASRVTLDPGDLKVTVEYLDGPFRHLENRWRFVPEPGGCAVHFYIDYEFRSRALALLVGSVFNRAFHKFSAAFEARAREVYGTQPATSPALEGA